MVKNKYSKYAMQIVSRADPIICGHSGESRNIAETAHKLTRNKVSIVTYSLNTLRCTRLPLKKVVEPYSKGVVIDRPEPREDYKIIEGNILNAISGKIIENVDNKKINVIMSLYIVPHSQIVLNSIKSIKFFDPKIKTITIAEAVGSDITNVVKNCLSKKMIGQAKLIFSDYLANDLPIAVSKFTKQEIVRYASKIFKPKYVRKMEKRIKVFYPTINADYFINSKKSKKIALGILRKKGLPTKKFKSYFLFLSRITKAKSVFDLVLAYEKIFPKLKTKSALVIAGEGPGKKRLEEFIKKKKIHYVYLTGSVTEKEKLNLMYGCRAFILPTKPTKHFTETFGIVLAEKLLVGGDGLIVTCEIGGVPEATGNYCIYAKQDNPQDLSEKILKAISIPKNKRLEINKEGQKYALKNFDRDKTVSAIFKEIDKIAKNK